MFPKNSILRSKEPPDQKTRTYSVKLNNFSCRFLKVYIIFCLFSVIQSILEEYIHLNLPQLGTLIDVIIEPDCIIDISLIEHKI